MDLDTKFLISAAMLQDLLVSKDGEPLAYGKITCYNNDSRLVLKNWYYMTDTPGGPTFLPLPNPLYLSGAGTICDSSGNDTIPFYYIVSETDNVTPELYYITVEGPIDNCTGRRCLQFTRSNFPFSGEHGGEPAENTGNLDNYIINGRFWRNINTFVTSGSALATSNMFAWTTQYNNSGSTFYHKTLAPSQHDDFSMPDIQYVKNVLGSTDTIIFKQFPAEASEILTGDITGEYYLSFNCTVTQLGETLKCIQIPISLHNLTLANVPFTFTIQAQSISGTDVISASIYQFAGSGNASVAPILIGEGSFTINNNWQKYSFTDVFPSTVGLSSVTTNDDALYLQINMPTAGEGLCNINIALPSIYLSTIEIPTNNFETYDQIDSIINTPRLGDIRTSLNDFYPFGWVPLTGGTIGSLATIPTVSTYLIPYKPTLSDASAWPLYNLIWQKFYPYSTGSSTAGVNILAPMYNSAGTQVGYGAAISGSGSAITDWNSGNVISLTDTMGAVIMGTVPLTALLTAYSTTVTPSSGQVTVTATNSGGGMLLTTGSTVNYYNGMPFYISNTGGTLPVGSPALSAGTVYYVQNFNGTNAFNISINQSNLINYTLVGYVSAGTGTNSVTPGQVFTAANTVAYFNGMPVTIANVGGTLPTGLSANTIYYVSNFNGTTAYTLSTTFANAIMGVAINFSANNSGVNTISAAMTGTYEGEYAHTQLWAELAPHRHPPLPPLSSFVGGNGNTLNLPSTTGRTYGELPTTGSTGSSRPMNVTQPSVFLNMYMKL